ncbi:MAG TPA: FAD-dependent oxidoreductase [Candidatus Lokiarchaeia archaeon]
MKIVIVGNNVAGTFSAQNIRNLDKDVEIEIFSEENYPYYTRIKLPDIISEQFTIENLIVFKEEWYKKNKIKINLNKKVVKINPKQKQIFVENDKKPISYDKLVIAIGSSPSVPPIKNAFEYLKKGVFTLRNVKDALEIRNYIKTKKVKKAIIIGGGLLGLELAKQIKNCNLDTTVVEFFPRLLPKQLDDECGEMLKKEIENMGIKIVLNVSTEEILGNSFAKGIKLKDGRIFDSELILIQAGVKPNIDLAKDAKINTNKGIVVNQFLETGEQDIYAVGDCIEYKNQTWGIIPAAMEQSKILASSILGKKDDKYEGTVPKTTLKIVGIDLTSIGVFDPPEKEGGGWEILKKSDKKNCCYKKIVLKDNKLKGAILFGEKKSLNYINSNIESEVDPEELKEILEL